MRSHPQTGTLCSQDVEEYVFSLGRAAAERDDRENIIQLKRYRPSFRDHFWSDTERDEDYMRCARREER